MALRKFATMGLSLVCLVLHVLTVVGVMTTAETVISTKLGRIRGTQESSQPATGKQFLAFRGIPYAKPPVEELRWQDPVPFGAWNIAVLDATKFAPMCPQFDMATKNVIGDENCLYLNVFTPRVPGQGSFAPREGRDSNDLDSSQQPQQADMEPRQFQTTPTLPVMVWFHGGGFIRGGSHQFGPEFLMREDIVLVTVNYRLGVLGFLSTADKNLPGNYAMLDQIEALRWVRDNIADYGGNPNRVNIFGESAGGAITHLLSLSPLAIGLFQNVIFQSGSALCDWSLEKNPMEYAVQVGTKVNCTARDSFSLVSCLRTKSTEQLVRSSNELLKHTLLPLRTAPVVDAATRTKPFLPDLPRNLIKNNQYRPLPMMSGVTSDEGLLFFLWTYIENMGKMSSPEFVEKDLLPSLISSVLKNNTKLDAIVDAIKQQYFAGVNFADLNSFLPPFSQMLDDAMFTSCVYEAQLLHARHAPLYAYLFSYKGELTPSYGARFIDVLRRSSVEHPLMQTGVSHADELLYLFRMAGSNAEYSPTDMQISLLMTRLWTNFAISGAPMPNTVTTEGFPFWAPVPATSEDVPYLTISAAPRISSNFRKAEMKFWTRVTPYVRNLAMAMSQESESYLMTTWTLLALFLISLVVIATLVFIIVSAARRRRYPDRGVTLQRSS